MPKNKWVNDNIYSPSKDGMYLVYYYDSYTVFERCDGEWLDRDCRIVTEDLDKLWWMEFPEPPKEAL